MVAGWAYFINANSFAAIWAMFGVANQMLAVIALAIVSVYLFNEGRGRYLWVTVLPMIVVFTTTSTAAVTMLGGQLDTLRQQVNNPAAVRNVSLLVNSAITGSLILAMLLCTAIIIIAGGVRIAGLGRTAPRRGLEVASPA